jgi:hypothetical protein
VEIKYHI